MRVLLDARKLGHGGIGLYLENLIEGLLSLKEERPELTLIVRPDFSPFRWMGEVETITECTGLYSFAELFSLAGRLPLKEFDLFHVPHFTLPLKVSIPSVVTIHDLIQIYHPQRFYYPFIARPLISSTLKRATKVIAVSKSTENDIGRFVNGAPSTMDKVTVIPNALSPFLRGRYKEPKFRAPYLLSIISTAKPHKGLHDLLAAYEAVRVRQGADKVPQLIIAGQGVGQGEHAGVTLLGSVTNEELLGLYRGAHTLIVPSLTEGFCFSALQAKSFGVQVVSRPVPSVKELLTTEDIVAQDFSVEALSHALALAITRTGKTTGLSKELTTKCEIGAVARVTLEVYRAAVRNNTIHSVSVPRKIASGGAA